LLQPDQPSFLPALAYMMLPRVVERGVASADQIDLNTLAQRIEAEHRNVGGMIVWDLAFLIAARSTSVLIDTGTRLPETCTQR